MVNKVSILEKKTDPIKQHHLLFLRNDAFTSIAEVGIAEERGTTTQQHLESIAKVVDQLLEKRIMADDLADGSDVAMSTSTSVILPGSSGGGASGLLGCMPGLSNLNAAELSNLFRLKIILSPLRVKLEAIRSNSGFDEEQGQSYLEAIKQIAQHFFGVILAENPDPVVVLHQRRQLRSRVVGERFPALCLALCELSNDEMFPKTDLPGECFDLCATILGRCLALVGQDVNQTLYLGHAVEALGQCCASTSVDFDLRDILGVFVNSIKRIKSIERHVVQVCGALNSLMLLEKSRAKAMNESMGRNEILLMRNTAPPSLGGSGDGTLNLPRLSTVSTGYTAPTLAVGEFPISANLQALGLTTVLQDWIRAYPDVSDIQREALLSLCG